VVRGVKLERRHVVVSQSLEPLVEQSLSAIPYRKGVRLRSRTVMQGRSPARLVGTGNLASEEGCNLGGEEGISKRAVAGILDMDDEDDEVAWLEAELAAKEHDGDDEVVRRRRGLRTKTKSSRKYARKHVSYVFFRFYCIQWGLGKYRVYKKRS